MKNMYKFYQALQPSNVIDAYARDGLSHRILGYIFALLLVLVSVVELYTGILNPAYFHGGSINIIDIYRVIVYAVSVLFITIWFISKPLSIGQIVSILFLYASYTNIKMHPSSTIIVFSSILIFDFIGNILYRCFSTRKKEDNFLYKLALIFKIFVVFFYILEISYAIFMWHGFTAKASFAGMADALFSSLGVYAIHIPLISCLRLILFTPPMWLSMVYLYIISNIINGVVLLEIFQGYDYIF